MKAARAAAIAWTKASIDLAAALRRAALSLALERLRPVGPDVVVGQEEAGEVDEAL